MRYGYHGDRLYRTVYSVNSIQEFPQWPLRGYMLAAVVPPSGTAQPPYRVMSRRWNASNAAPSPAALTTARTPMLSGSSIPSVTTVAGS